MYYLPRLLLTTYYIVVVVNYVYRITHATICIWPFYYIEGDSKKSALAKKVTISKEYTIFVLFS